MSEWSGWITFVELQSTFGILSLYTWFLRLYLNFSEKVYLNFWVIFSKIYLNILDCFLQKVVWPPWRHQNYVVDVIRKILQSVVQCLTHKLFVSLHLIVPDKYSLKVQSCKLNNNKYMIASTQITNTEIFAFIAVLVFKLLSRKVLFINKKDNSNY